MPRKDFQAQSPDYKPVEGQRHSVELRWLPSDLRWQHPTQAACFTDEDQITKDRHSSKCYQIFESSEEQLLGKHGFRDKCLKFNMFATHQIQNTTSFSLLIDISGAHTFWHMSWRWSAWLKKKIWKNKCMQIIGFGVF